MGTSLHNEPRNRDRLIPFADLTCRSSPSLRPRYTYEFVSTRKHVACAQFAFFNEFEGKKPPEDCEKGGNDPAKTKAELIKYLKDSFDYSNRVLATLTANNALDRVEGRYAGPNTKLGISIVAVWHITDHYGQLVEYLRLNGIVPPMTQKYGVKVR